MFIILCYFYDSLYLWSIIWFIKSFFIFLFSYWKLFWELSIEFIVKFIVEENDYYRLNGLFKVIKGDRNGKEIKFGS